MKTKLNLTAAGMAILLVSGARAAEPPATISNPVTPGTISYQGRLQTADGQNYTNGVYDIEFRIYSAVSAGDLLWGAAYKPYVQNGYFSVILGATGVGETALSNTTYSAVEDFWKAMWIDPANTDPANAERFLELTVLQDKDNQPIITPPPQPSFPRQQFLASPYAIQAQYAQSASRSDADFMVASNLTVAGVATVNDLTLTSTNKPFMVRSYYAADNESVVFSTGVSSLEYTAAVVGFDAGWGDLHESGSDRLWEVLPIISSSGDEWQIRCQAPTHGSFPDWTVHVLFIRNDLVDDQRTDWGTLNGNG